jgi:hypothetical protein
MSKEIEEIRKRQIIRLGDWENKGVSSPDQLWIGQEYQDIKYLCTRLDASEKRVGELESSLADSKCLGDKGYADDELYKVLAEKEGL